MNKKSLTLTVLIDAHANYGEGLGNISTVQKITKNNKQYAIRTKESLKNSIMTNSGFYDSLNTTVDGATQKMVSEDNTIENDRSLEGGYMTTKPKTFKRNSSFSISDAISINPFSIETRFCNNLGMATNYAKANNINVNDDAKKAGLMPYQFEVDAEYKLYSITIDLEAIGIDENFNINTDTEEKIDRVNYLMDTVQHLSLLCKGFLDNAELKTFDKDKYNEGKNKLYSIHEFNTCIQNDLTNQKEILSEEDIDRIYSILEPFSKVDENIKTNHINRIQEKYN